MKTFLLFAAILFNNKFSAAQNKPYQFTVIGEGATTLFFNNVKQPGFSIKLLGEKQFVSDEMRYFFLELGYTMVGPVKSKTELLSSPGTTTVTYTYHSSSLVTLTFGARKYLENKIVFGVKMGVGIYDQGATYTIYSDPILNYDQHHKKYGNWGLGSTAMLGYKPGNFEFRLSYHGVYDIFKTTDLNDRESRDLSGFVAAIGIGVGYTF